VAPFKNPDEALAALLEGNRRHQAGKQELQDHSPVGDERPTRQEPFAAIISCADSRVSPTLIFDVEPGNVFSSRVAGNIVDSGSLGSTEYAVKVLGVKLVMVLGHSNCGAVRAAVEASEGDATYPPDEFGAIGEIVERILPAIGELPEGERDVETGVRANAAAQAAELASRGPIVKRAVEAGELAVVAAVYDIGTGAVSLVRD
jgi:carbonic anhydrase